MLFVVCISQLLPAPLNKGNNNMVLFGSQPEDGSMNKAETCRCCDLLIVFYLYYIIKDELDCKTICIFYESFSLFCSYFNTEY
jgi:hypothetical protein